MDMHIIGVSDNRWHGQWMNRQHMFWALKEHARVLYVQEPKALRRVLKREHEFIFRTRVTKEAEQLLLLELPSVLAEQHRSVRFQSLCRSLKSCRINSVARSTNDVPTVLYMWHPKLWFYANMIKADFVVYHMFDLTKKFQQGLHANNEPATNITRACSEADLVITGTSLQATATGRDDAIIIPNAVDFESFQRPRVPPPELNNLNSPIVGYIGTISDKVDINWLEAISNVRSWNLVLIGPLRKLSRKNGNVVESIISKVNCHYLGEKPHTELPAYYQSLDIGLMPYARGLHCETSSPLKLYEYAAAGVPMVGSRLPSLVSDPIISSLISLVDTPAEAVAAIADELAPHSRHQQKRKLIEYAQQNSWACRAEVLVEAITDKFTRSRKVKLQD